jgi:AcrR family transcriptional regulator
VPAAVHKVPERLDIGPYRQVDDQQRIVVHHHVTRRVACIIFEAPDKPGRSFRQQIDGVERGYELGVVGMVEGLMEAGDVQFGQVHARIVTENEFSFMLTVVTAKATPTPALRSDARASRLRLTDAVGIYIDRTGEVPTRLADVAAEAGVGLATAYRHFDDVDAVVDEFILRLPTAATDQFNRRNRPTMTPVERFEVWNRAWVDACLRFGVSATRLRSPVGFLQRRQEGDPIVAVVCTSVEPLLEAMTRHRVGARTGAGAGQAPKTSSVDLLWIWNALSDPREVLDQHHTRRRSAARIAHAITKATIAAAKAIE